jgi:thioredoxin-related protein
MRHLPHTFAALILALSATAARAEINWEANLRTAKEKAEQDGKLLLLHFYSDHCVWCDRLEAGAFKAPEVAHAIHRHYVPVKIHAGHNPANMPRLTCPCNWLTPLARCARRSPITAILNTLGSPPS